ncbi:MAG TPA: hypothetical protein VE401_03135 [Solirubrobacterales bacterium]|jgi:hypothetical protein|nr:hypothetical protein [Solirubrobacterales bacterium]
MAAPSEGRRPTRGDTQVVGIFRSLAAHERLAVAGAAIVVASLFLPWYGVTLAGGLVKTALGTFGLIEAALILTVGSAALLILSSARGYALPRPLDEGTLLAVAGVWAALLIAYRMIDRPDFELAGAGPVGLRYGIFVALIGAALLVVGGLRKRREERG